MISDRIRQSDLSGNDLGLAQAEDVSVMGDASALGILLNNLTAKRGPAKRGRPKGDGQKGTDLFFLF
ncbi:hypothetical protein ACSESI_25700 [Pseudomonas aeruginosa]|uniref:hypothetical protein n=1 Tax=Pseudomonas aeruginosa TaxID=287 RepID=UPI0020C3B914|nr:hypothetical protein [Pseudomonas aeruginosa]HBO4831597.1 hypothetical protein [Pseudomonas aeruginosa]